MKKKYERKKRQKQNRPKKTRGRYKFTLNDKVELAFKKKYRKDLLRHVPRSPNVKPYYISSKTGKKVYYQKGLPKNQKPKHDLTNKVEIALKSKGHGMKHIIKPPPKPNPRIGKVLSGTELWNKWCIRNELKSQIKYRIPLHNRQVGKNIVHEEMKKRNFKFPSRKRKKKSKKDKEKEKEKEKKKKDEL